MIFSLERSVLRGELPGKEDALALYRADPGDLTAAANRIREARCGSGVDLCSIVNARCGRCSEDCRYCAQSSHYHVKIDEYPLLSSDTLVARAAKDAAAGSGRFSLVTSGRRPCAKELELLCDAISRIKREVPISVCASLGLLNDDDFVALRQAGLDRYHHNLETSRRFFPSICTTHTYDDKLATIASAHRAGLEVCSGGIIGLGESREDRVELALELRSQGIHSIPINVLNPVPGTPLENQPILTGEEVCRTIAVFRFLLPDAALRLAGGRGLFPDHGRCFFQSGANAAITGDMLTTTGISFEEDRRILVSLGFDL